ncbi:MAG: TIGR03087 family PEP-CTERM/XrtA system glycosyltransferase [Burkholderiaceae bacterium]
MRILILCHRFPFPPKRGGKIRPFNVIQHLAKSHEVVVCSLARSEQERAEGQGIGEYCHGAHSFTVNESVQWARMITRLPTTTPSSMGYFYSREMARSVDSLLASEPFDLIFVHCSSVAPYVVNVTSIPKVLDFGDMDSQKWLDYRQFKPWPLSMGYWLEGRKMERAERLLAEKFDMCTATTHAEWAHLESLGAARQTGWFPNGVDSEFFSPDGQTYDPQRICFVGRMDYFPNQQAMFEFCEHTWPKLRQAMPELNLDIVGADPSAAVRELARLPGVTVTGSVPDVRPFVRRAMAMVAPLRIARGTQNKILESMALGVPVVTTGLAAGGVDAVAGEHLLVADTVDEQIAALLKLHDNPEYRSDLANKARERVLDNHSWVNSMRRLDQILDRLLAGATRRNHNSQLLESLN